MTISVGLVALALVLIGLGLWLVGLVPVAAVGVTVIVFAAVLLLAGLCGDWVPDGKPR